MARRRPPLATAPQGDALILPRHLVEPIAYNSKENAEALRTQHRERDEWMRAHGVDMKDFYTVRAIQTASEVAHGFPASDALSRARRRALIANEEQA